MHSEYGGSSRGGSNRRQNLTETSKQYIVHVLGLAKSYWPQARLTPLGDGMAHECTEDRFTEYVEGAKPVAARIVEMLEQELEAEA